MATPSISLKTFCVSSYALADALSVIQVITAIVTVINAAITATALLISLTFFVFKDFPFTDKFIIIPPKLMTNLYSTTFVIVTYSCNYYFPLLGGFLNFIGIKRKGLIKCKAYKVKAP